MAQNYDFLRARWPKLAALASDAMRLVDISPSVSLSSMRTFCDWASGLILEMKGMPPAENADAFTKESALLASGAIPQNVKDAFRAIDAAPSRMKGPLGNAEVSRECLEQLDVIAGWMVTEAGGTAPAPAYTPGRPASTGSASPRRSSFGAQAETSDASALPGRSPSYSRKTETPPQEERPFYEEPEDGEEEEEEEDAVSPYGGGRPPQSSGPRIKNPLVLLIPIIIVCILIVILAVSLLSKKTGSGANATPAPTAPILATMPPTATPLPTESPTPAPAVVTYLQDLTWTDSGFASGNVHLGQWNSEGQGQFQIEDVTYDHGIGMFISSKEITATRATRTITYDLKGMYSTLMFDLGADKNWCYGSQSEYGSYRLVIRVDGVAVWDSGGLAATDGAKMSNTIPITGGQTMIIELTQRKGTKGTLNIVLGNIRLESNGVGAYAATVPPTSETPDPSATPTAAAETPAPTASPAA